MIYEFVDTRAVVARVRRWYATHRRRDRDLGSVLGRDVALVLAAETEGKTQL